MSETAQLPAVKKPELVASGGPIQPIIPRSIDEVFRLAEGVCGAGLAPDSYKNDPRKVMIGLMKALELGVAPLQGLAGIAIINGRPSVWGDLLVALCQSRGSITNQEVIWHGEFPQDDFGCEFRVWRRGQSSPYIGRFSIADAKAAKLWANPSKAPWISSPKRMLQIRARAFALRDGFADHLAGMAIAEEAYDLPPKPMGEVTLLADGTPLPQKPDLAFLDDAVEEANAEIVG